MRPEPQAHPTTGWTAFHHACCDKRPGCALALVQAGCDVGAKDSEGRGERDPGFRGLT